MVRQYVVVGRRIPKEGKTQDDNSEMYRMKIFAPNEVIAKSRFWYFLSKLRKLKKANGQIVVCSAIHEKNPNVIKNYGIWLRYNSRTGTHNMYKEYRDLTLNGAVDQMYNDMAARHRARRPSIHILRTDIIAAKDVKRTANLQFINSKIRFPLGRNYIRRFSSKKYRTVFKASRPSTQY